MRQSGAPTRDDSVAAAGGPRKGRGFGAPASSDNPVVGGRYRRRSSYGPSNPSGIGYTGGHAANLYFAQNPGYRTTTSSFQFTPYRDDEARRILDGIMRQGTIVDLHLALVQAGFIDNDVDFNYISSDTEDAMETVLTIANQHAMAWQDVLSQYAAGDGYGADGSGAGGAGGGGGGGGGTIITLPNRDDLAAAQEDVFMAMTGEAIGDDLRDHAVDAIMDTLRTQQERQVQETMGFSGDGVMFQEDAPDPGRLLEEEVEKRAPGKVMGKGVRDMAEMWFEGLAGPV